MSTQKPKPTINKEWVDILLKWYDEDAKKWRQKKSDTRNNILAKEREVRQKEHELKSLIKQSLELEMLINHNTRKSATEVMGNIEEEVMLISDLVPDIFRSIKITDMQIVAYTYPIEIEWNSFKYLLGEYSISIAKPSRLTNYLSQINIYNLFNPSFEFLSTDPTLHFHHPHVLGNRIPDFGKFTEQINGRLLRGEYRAVLSIVNEFLTTYDPNSCYAKIENWGSNYKKGEFECED